MAYEADIISNWYGKKNLHLIVSLSYFCTFQKRPLIQVHCTVCTILSVNGEKVSFHCVDHLSFYCNKMRFMNDLCNI